MIGIKKKSLKGETIVLRKPIKVCSCGKAYYSIPKDAELDRFGWYWLCPCVNTTLFLGHQGGDDGHKVNKRGGESI